MKNTTAFLKDVFITSLKIDFAIFSFVSAFLGFVLLILCSWEYVLVCVSCFGVVALYQIYKAFSQFKEEQAQKELERLHLAEKKKVKYVIIK